MTRTFDEGWLRGARRAPSPHCDARPPGTAIELVVIHAMSLPAGQFGTGCPADLFTGILDCDTHDGLRHLADVRVSAHFLIERTGELIQFVPVEQRAWHAGVSRWRGREACNDFSIGIELEGCDAMPFSEAQYVALSSLLRDLREVVLDLGPQRLTGHSDIAPDRKTDPGPYFDWQRVYAGLK